MVNAHGTISRQGNVELCIYGRWRIMCANSWDNRDASVVCRQIGYSPHGKHEIATFHTIQVALIYHTSQFTGAVALENIYPSSTHRLLNTEINCSGLESKITNCIQNLDEAYSCLSFGIASVSCYSMSCNSDYFLQLVTMLSSLFCSWNSS